MDGTAQSPRLARFECFEVNLQSGELCKNGDRIKLPEQSFQILRLLLERPRQVVSRQEIQKKLWPNDTVVEFENSINTAIKKLRLALGDSADQPRFVETLARRGYRWMTPVQWIELSSQTRQGPAQSASATDHSVSERLGKKVSHYRVLEIVGGGGMGVVYQAEDLKLGRRVALKFLPDEMANSPEAMQRFEREARAASALNHPNICTIHSIEEQQGQPFIVMELLDGKTLRDSINDAPMPVATVLNLACQIAAGLQAAHGKGIIHRDIKPANIFVTRQGQVKILDFGLAKLHDSAPSESPISDGIATVRQWDPLLTLTRTGTAIGTAGYMSPEQLRGEELDTRTDLFSFGLVLYQMATGQRAFPQETASQLRDAIWAGSPLPPRQLNSVVPSKLEFIINKALEKDRNARYQTAGQILADLAGLNPRMSRPALAGKLMALAAAALILAGGVIWVARDLKKPAASIPEIKLRQLTTNSSENPVIGGVISPDGKYLAYSDTRGLYLKLVDTGETHAIPVSEELRQKPVKWLVVAWFPDSTRLLANAYPASEIWSEWSSKTSSVWAVSVLGEPPLKLRDRAIVCSISPDGSTVSFVTKAGSRGEREVWLMGPGGEDARKYSETQEGTGWDCWGWFSPDGKHVGGVFNDKSGNMGISQNLSTGKQVTIFDAAELAKANDFIWLHDGRVLYDQPEPDSEVCNYWIGRIDLNTGKRLQQPVRLTNWPNFCVSSGSATNDGKRLAFAAETGFSTTDVADLGAAGSRIVRQRHFTQEERDAYGLDWTADSKSLIVGHGHTSDKYGMSRQSLDSLTSEPLFGPMDGGWANRAVVTPDGRWLIAALRQKPPVPGAQAVEPLPLVRFPITGGKPETILQVAPSAAVSCTKSTANLCVIAEASNDNRWMIVSSLDPIAGRGPELARIDLERLVDPLVEDVICVVSPDGTRLALARSPHSAIEIHSLRGQPLQTIPFQTPEKLVSIRWVANQDAIFVATRAPGGSQLLHLDLRGNAKLLAKCGGANSCLPIPSTDGRRLAIVDRKVTMNIWMMENF